MNKGTIITTFFLNGRVKTFEGKSENDNLKKFLDEYSEATPELFENNNKIISHRYFGDKVTTNYIYKTKEEINNFLDCKFQSNN